MDKLGQDREVAFNAAGRSSWRRGKKAKVGKEMQVLGTGWREGDAVDGELAVQEASRRVGGFDFSFFALGTGEEVDSRLIRDTRVKASGETGERDVLGWRAAAQTGGFVGHLEADGRTNSRCLSARHPRYSTVGVPHAAGGQAGSGDACSLQVMYGSADVR